jgi:CheY-like chemotaxis protein
LEEPHVQKGPGAAPRGRILVIDDDPDIRTMVCLVLGREGYKVSSFDDGRRALEGVTEAPDLILLDYMMPRLSAPSFLDARREHPMLRDAPVVVISAYPELAEIIMAETVGVVHKPMDLDLLVECVHYHCHAGR